MYLRIAEIIKVTRTKVEFSLRLKKIHWLRISLEEIYYHFHKIQPNINQIFEKFHCYACPNFCVYLGSDFVKIRLTLDLNSALDLIDRGRGFFIEY